MQFLLAETLPYISLVVGFIFLIKSADLLIEGGVSIARRYKISNIVIGMTIVAFGTTVPELVVNVIASIQGKSDLVIGNIIGSNISNTLLILGATSIIYPIAVDKITIKREIPISFAILLFLFWVVTKDVYIGYSYGIFLLCLFILFLFSVLARANHGVNSPKVARLVSKLSRSNTLSISTSVTYMVFGAIGLAIGGKLVTDSASSIAFSHGIREGIIGLTLIAVGTSLPEFATSVVAALKKQTGIGIGNIIGANIFNLLWILGVSALINPILIPSGAYIDVAVAALATFILFLMLALKKPYKITRIEGIILLILYASYITTTFMRV